MFLPQDRDQFQLSTLSHLINARAAGYQDLPPFPEEAPDPSVRCVELPVSVTPEARHRPSYQKKTKSQKVTSFYSDESSPEDESEEDDSESDSDSSDSDSSASSSDEDNDSDSEDEEPQVKRKDTADGKKISQKEESSQSSDSEDSDSSSSSSSSGTDSSSEEESESSDDLEEDVKKKKGKQEKVQKSDVPQGGGNRSNLELLLALDDTPPAMDTPVLTPSLGGLLTPSPSSQSAQPPLPPGASIQPASAKFVPTVTQELLNRLSGGGLAVAGRFTRSPHLYSPRMTSVEISFTNSSSEEIRDISVGRKKLAPGMSLHEFAGIAVLTPDTTLYGTLGVDFNDTTQPAAFDLVAGGRTYNISITAPVGELLMPLAMNESDFNHNQVRQVLFY